MCQCPQFSNGDPYINILVLVGKLSAVFRMQIAEQTDERSRIMNEIIMAMRLIKCYAWEKPFAQVINKLRV